jgi:hypothetical protein
LPADEGGVLARFDKPFVQKQLADAIDSISTSALAQPDAWCKGMTVRRPRSLGRQQASLDPRGLVADRRPPQ